MRQLSLAIVGAPYPNKDGGNRAFEIKLCVPGERLELRPEHRNRYDEHAIAVLSERGVQIGYVASERAVLVGSWLRTGEEVIAIFQEEAPWGAVARIGVGSSPSMVGPSSFRDRPAPIGEGSDPDPGFWPDDNPSDE